jgi:hypothetical protein
MSLGKFKREKLKPNQISFSANGSADRSVGLSDIIEG